MELVGWIIAAGGVATAGTAIWQKVLKPGYRSTQELAKLQRAASELLMAQLRPNGGSSLLDRFTKMERIQQCMQTEQGEMKADVAAIKSQLIDGDRRLDALELAAMAVPDNSV